LLLVCGLIAATLLSDAASTWSGYPFLVGAAPAPPDVVYMPTYSPDGSRPSTMRIRGGASGVDLETTSVLASGDDLLIWESTRDNARIETAVGRIVEDATVSGVLAVWHRAHTPDGRTNVLFARIGPTLVVIAGEAPVDELLRIADSMHRATARSLML